MPLYEMTAHQLHDLLLRKEVSAVEIAEACLERMEAVEGKVQAFINTTPEEALEQARRVDQRIAAGEEPGPLSGIPVGLKDNMCTKDLPTTCSSKMLQDFRPPYNATAWERLAQAGVALLGKLNMDEFAMGSSTENSRFFPSHNPWDLERVPGGSSGGATAAVAAGEAVIALGSDTGGSIRQPAAFCGVVGMKPTYGLVSRYGLIAFASSLDQIGPITRDITDCALVLQAIAGHDALDSTSADMPVPDYRQALREDVRGLKVGVPREYFVPGLHPEVERLVRQAVGRLEEMGAVVDEVSLPHTEYALPAYYIIAPAEASSNLARYDGVGFGFRAPAGRDVVEMYMETRSEGFGAEVKRRLMLGTYALSSGYYDAYYLKALQVRQLIKQDFDEAFQRFDLLVSPATPTPAFRLGEKAGDPLSMYLSDICTIPVNLAGLPALSLPCGLAEGLPVGLQVIAPPFREDVLLRAAYSLEQAMGLGVLLPPLEVK